MKNKKELKSHYLSISYKVLINNRIIHYLLVFIEVFLILLQIVEIYLNDFKPIKSENFQIFTPLTILLLKANKQPNIINFIIYLLIILILIINYYVLNIFRIKINLMVKIMINISELLFYRLLSLFIFNYLFILNNIHLYINIILTVIFVVLLILHFFRNILVYFTFKFINYPYDSFSMIIDLHLLLIKILLSISSATPITNISIFFFIISIIFLFILVFYLSYIMRVKSYYLMNNVNLNKVKYSILLACCIIIIFIVILDKKEITNIYYQISFFNILLICLLFIGCFYNPYNYVKFDNDGNIENIYYYFFIFDRDKNNYLLLEEKIEEHLSKCKQCNLCKKYDNMVKHNKKKEIDLYFIISDGKNYLYNFFNFFLRGLKKNGKNKFMNNSYYLINLRYIYSLSIYKQDYNFLLNLELLFDIINSENELFLEEFTISLKQIKYTNNFFIKANKIISAFYEIFDEQNLEKKSRNF